MKRVAEITREVEIVAREVKGHCAAGIKPGDKIVLKGANICKEKSGPICGYAFCGLYPVVFAVRLGVDLDNLGLEGRLWQCADPGQPYTPGGTVLFEVRPFKGLKE
ncbi:MAG: TIGR04076 family protein [Firmicutes bacterium]|nr:TIGR04076 family protein [Bacillota bacterium]